MERIFRIIYWVQIALSPILLFGIAALIVFVTAKPPLNLYIAIPLLAVGIVLGVLLAEWARRKKGAIEFVSDISSSNDLDEIVKNK